MQKRQVPCREVLQLQRHLLRLCQKPWQQQWRPGLQPRLEQWLQQRRLQSWVWQWKRQLLQRELLQPWLRQQRRQLQRWWLQQQQQAWQLPTLQWEEEEVAQRQIPWQQQQQQRRKLYQGQRLFCRFQVLLPAFWPVTWLPVHQAKLLWLINNDSININNNNKRIYNQCTRPPTMDDHQWQQKHHQLLHQLKKNN